MRHIAANVLSILIVVGILAAALIVMAKEDYTKPGPHAATVRFDVPEGARIGATARRLAEAGVLSEGTLWGAINGESLFRLGARYQGKAGDLKAAVYDIPPGASMPEILAIITSGRGVDHRITVPEGFTSWEVVELLKADPALTGEIAEIPAEGSLAPNTYFISPGTSRARVIARMQAAQSEILAEAWANRAEGLPLASPEEALILASIVEKETGVPSERRQVASVFVNRLRKGMRMETDPTVIYGITLGQGPLGRGLRRSELDRVTPYNTYQIDGLPPTPIANPGRAAIEAALNPDETEFLFFVADGTGGHAFAKTLAEHNANVRVWRRIEAQQGQQQP